MIAERNPEQTRERILKAAFDEIHTHGFQGMRVEQILSSTGLTKGALYHHFSGKRALGYAVVEEIIQKFNVSTWREPLVASSDPIATLQQILNSSCTGHSDEEIMRGCPLNNLAQEMSGLDEGFHERLQQIYMKWSETIASALAAGQKDGIVRADIDTVNVAMFIVSSIQGMLGAAKCMQSSDTLQRLSATLCDYIESLRA